MRFRNHATPLAFFRNPRTLPDVPSADALRRILERERARTERTGREFSFVVFDADGGDASNGDGLRRLADLLQRRIRVTDVVGRYEEKSLGVVLPATTAEGAWKFAEDVCKGIPATLPPPRITVYTYPSTWIPSEPPAGAPPPPPPASGSGGRISPPTAETSEGKKDMTMAVHRMERIFGCPLPPWKRLFDLVVASVALILASPLFLIYAAYIKIVSPGPVFYKQWRAGYLGRLFLIRKFRTMHHGNDERIHEVHLRKLISSDTATEKLDSRNDPRIIPLGRWIRKVGLDEIPQLLNVLSRDMSLVGPRPCLPYEAREYLTWATRRFDVLPGMTGLWQVSGKNRTTYKEMLRLDIRYLQRISPAVDLRILAKTVPVLLGLAAECLEIRQRPGRGIR
jgi:lipopolysaccharide/colanic/teichoic acid biosynthesis glycosyltransferase